MGNGVSWETLINSDEYKTGSAKEKSELEKIHFKSNPNDIIKTVFRPPKLNAETFPQTSQAVQELQANPLNLPKGNLQEYGKRVYGESIGQLVDAFKTEGQNIKQAFTPASSSSEKIGQILNAVTGGANAVFSLPNAVLGAVNNIPVVGQISKTAMLPFAATGDIGGGGFSDLLKLLPINKRAKENLNQPVSELGSLLGSVALGGAILGKGIKAFEKKKNPVTQYGDQIGSKIDRMKRKNTQIEPEIASEGIGQGATAKVSPEGLKMASGETPLNIKEPKIKETHRIAEEIDSATKIELEKIMSKNNETLGKNKDRLTHKEVAEFAKANPELRTTVFDREQTKKLLAATRNSRLMIRDLNEKVDSGRATPEEIYQRANMITEEIIDKAHAGRTLEYTKVLKEELPDSPSNVLQKYVLDKFQKAEMDIETMRGEIEKVNWNDLEAANTFYRTKLKPKWDEYLTAVRYNSMLSSLKTQEVNFIGNFINSGIVHPVVMTLRGGLDWVATPFKKVKKRRYYTKEGLIYFNEYIKASNRQKAFKEVVDILKNKKLPESLEQVFMPLSIKPDKINRPGTYAKDIAGRALDVALTAPMKLMYAMDGFATTLAKNSMTEALRYRAIRKFGGVKGYTKTKEYLKKLPGFALTEARKSLLTQDLGEKGIGKLNEMMDGIGLLVMKARSSKDATTRMIANFMVPFVKYPLNAFKEGISYTPFGIINLVGNKDKITAITKMLMGTAIMAVGASLASSGRLSWRGPLNPLEREKLTAAGWLPYSIKIGNRWFSLQSLSPVIQFPLAIVAAVYNSIENKKLSESQADAILKGVGKSWIWSIDQTMVRNYGELAGALSGDNLSVYRTVSSVPKQLIPYRAFLSMIERTVDPYERKIDKDGSMLQKTLQNIQKDIPGWAEKLEALKDRQGFDYYKSWSERLFSNLTPTKMAEENTKDMNLYKRDKEVKRISDYTGQLVEMIMRGDGKLKINSVLNDVIYKNPMQYIDMKDYKNRIMNKFSKIQRKLESSKSEEDKKEAVSDIMSGIKTRVSSKSKREIFKEQSKLKKEAERNSMRNYLRAK